MVDEIIDTEIGEEVSDEELVELDENEEECVFEDEEEEEEFEDDECAVTKVINIVKQPIVTSIIVGAEVDSKGAVKPMCKVSIERHLEDDIEIDEFDIIENDFEQLTSEVKMRIIALKESLN